MEIHSQAEFESTYTDKKLRLLRIFLPVGIALYVVFVPWDLMMAPSVAPKTFTMRMTLCALLALLRVLVPTPFMRKWYEWIMSVVVVVVVAGFGTAVILALIPGGFGAASGGIAMVVMFAAGAIRLSAIFTAIATGGATVVTRLAMSAIDEPTNMLVSKAMTLGGLSALAVLNNVWFNGDALSIFRYESQLQSKMEQSERLVRTVSTMRDERVLWLENTARFLRHELKNQVAEMATSLDMIDVSRASEQHERYVERARRSPGQMRRLVATASESPSLESALNVEDVLPLDLSAALADRVVDFRQAHPECPLQVDVEPGVEVLDSEDRLAQLLDKLLSNAVEHLGPGGELRLSLHREDGLAELGVENDGDPLPGNAQRIFDAFFTEGKNAVGPDHLGLGLFVARTIVESHGGTISAEDLTQRTGARFLVRLPTHHCHDA